MNAAAKLICAASNSEVVEYDWSMTMGRMAPSAADNRNIGTLVAAFAINPYGIVQKITDDAQYVSTLFLTSMKLKKNGSANAMDISQCIFAYKGALEPRRKKYWLICAATAHMRNENDSHSWKYWLSTMKKSGWPRVPRVASMGAIRIGIL